MNRLRVKLKGVIGRFIKSKGKYAYLYSIPKNAKVLDVGAGNNSPFVLKTLRSDIYYTGIDVGLYNQSEDICAYADEFILTEPDNFHLTIKELKSEFDAIICSLNLEHCNDYAAVIFAMTSCLKRGGKIYISFPCEESIHLPSRKGCLNFFDDDTHKNVIKYTSVASLLQKNNIEIEFSTKRYRPIIPFIVGLIYEPIGRLLNRQAPINGTWALYGFETIFIGRKR